MKKHSKTLLLGAMLLCSIFSTIYLNVEMSSYETTVAGHDMHSLPDVTLIQHFIRVIIEPLTQG